MPEAIGIDHALPGWVTSRSTRRSGSSCATCSTSSAARHVSDDGVVLVERHEPGWVDAAAPIVTERHGVTFTFADVSHPEPGVVAATAVYTIAAVASRQRFVEYEVGDEPLTDLA